MNHKIFGLILFAFFVQLTNAQSLLEQRKTFTRADTLRGSLRPERTCFDVTFYELSVKVDTGAQTIAGGNRIVYKTVNDFTKLQIDLYANMLIDSIMAEGKVLKYKREFNAIFVDMPRTMKAGEKGELIAYYHGKPTVAKRPPWDGGFTWTTDDQGRFWLGVSCEGMGASLWWPCKDYLGDEPDSVRVMCNVPKGLKCVLNGILEAEIQHPADTTITYSWKVNYPINNYDISLNIGNYVHFSDTYVADDKTHLALDYYVLDYNLKKAKEQFLQVKPMLKCYEKYLGKYPFWMDGYALVETPYLGMEHQEAIAYGNKYQSGYAGYDFSRIGLDFDYIIIHESAHEWWGNSVSCKDLADMWIHESFATYTESMYVDCMYGSDTALMYINAKKSTVGNKAPIVGTYGVNEEGDGDMYNKGMLFLHTLRHVVNNDPKWWSIIKGMCDTTFKMKTIGYDDVVKYFNDKTGMNLTAVFDQYLKHAKIPLLQYNLKKDKGNTYIFSYKWKTDSKDFLMPFTVSTDNRTDHHLNATNDWNSTTITLEKENDLRIRDDLGYFNTTRYFNMDKAK